MNKITGINLNGNAYQLEEPGFVSLSAYLADAKSHLAGNPDQQEIMADLEQAIADKFQRFLSTHKSVITEDEVATVIGEMGPVDGDGTENNTHTESQTAGPKRLYRVVEGEVIGGVANGVAAYLNVDVVIIRIIFVLLAIVTTGGFIFAYILAMIFVPVARTKEEQAAASGAPFNAEELIARAKAEYAKFGDKSSEWKSQFRKMRKEHKRQAHQYKKWANQAKYEKYANYANYHHKGDVFGQLMGILVVSFFLWLGYHHVSVIHDFLDAVWNLVHRVSDRIAQFVVEHDNN